MLTAYIIGAAAFGIMGVLFACGKGRSLMAGYGGRAIRERYDERALCAFAAKVMFALMACFLLMAAGEWMDSAIPMWIAWPAVIIIGFGSLIYAAWSGRLKKQE